MARKLIENSGKNTGKVSSCSCPRCGGTGFILYQKDKADVYGEETMIDYARPCPECRGGIEERSQQTRQRANIPDVYYNATLNQFDWEYTEDGKRVDMDKRKKTALSFVSDFPKWEEAGMGLYIHSRTRGSGKTMLASCLCNELMKSRALITKFVRAGDLLDIVKGADQNSAQEYERNPVKLLQRCKLLVLDDIGQKQSGGSWLNDILFQIVDQRNTSGLVTIYTSNVPIHQLDVDERIISRIHEKTVPFPLPEFSHRGKVANLKKKDFLAQIGVM